MEYVDGVNLSDLLKHTGPMPICDSCELIRQAAIGLQHAFENGLVHRDIKPGNLMLTRQGQVKMLDLGLALLHDNQLGGLADLTTTGQLMGTIDYMAPEQAESTRDVDIRADIYSLGATLYALLCGAAPFGGEEYSSILKKMAALASGSAAPLREQRPDVPEQLAAVVHRMLSRDPNERFSQPADVAEALASFVAGANLGELLQLGGVQPDEQPRSAITDTLASAANAASDTSVTKPPEIEKTLVLAPQAPQIEGTTSSISLAAALRQRSRSRRPLVIGVGVSLVFAFLAAIIISIRTPAGTIIVEMSQPEIAGAEVTIDGESVLTIQTGTGEESIKVAADQEKHLLKVTKRGFETFTSEFTLSQAGLKTIVVRLEPLIAEAPPSQLPAAEANVAAARMPLPIGAETVRVCGDNQDVFWHNVTDLAFQPNGNLLAVASQDGQIQIRDTAVRKLLYTLTGHDSFVRSVAFSPDGQQLVSGSFDNTAIVWDLTERRAVVRYSQHRDGGHIQNVAWSPDGKLVASGNYDGELHLWNPQTADAVHRMSLGQRVESIAFSNDRNVLAIGLFDGTIQLIDPSGNKLLTLEGGTSPARAIAFVPRSTTIATATNSTIQLWDTLTGAKSRTLDGHSAPVVELACTPRGETLVATDRSGSALIWNIATRESRIAIEHNFMALSALAINGDGSQAVISGPDKILRFVDIDTGKIERTSGTDLIDSRAIVFSADGSTVFSNSGRDLQVWRAESGELVASILTDGQVTDSATLSSDGKRLFTSGYQGISMRDGATGHEIRSVVD